MDKKKIALVALACVVVLYLDFNFILQAQLGGAKRAEPQIAKLKKDLGDLAKDLARMEDLKKKQAVVEQTGAQGKKAISEEQIAEALQQISLLANKSNVKIAQIKPLKEPPGTKQDKSAPPVGGLKPLSISLDLTCGYHHLGQFINDLENAEIFIAVQEMKITAQPKDYLQQKVNLVLKTYVKR